MIAFKLITVILLIFACMAVISCQDSGRVIKEASGITRNGDELLIVGDDASGRYYEYDIPEYSYKIIPIDPAKVREVKLPGAELADDLEAIGILADGRVAVLSELLHSLIAKPDTDSKRYTIVAYYNKSFTEFGNRGLEGIAIKREKKDKSKIAVLWEGGYPVSNLIPDELQGCAARKALKPRIVIHEIKSNKKAKKSKQQSFTLDVPVPDDDPFGQRYRGSALVWFNGADSNEGNDCLIVLLQSENSPGDDKDSRTSFKHKVLQRFDLEGKPFGEPFNIIDQIKSMFEELDEAFYTAIGTDMSGHVREIHQLLIKSNWEDINFEGMGWFIENESLILIYDKHPKDPPLAFIVEIPASWK